MDIAFIIDSSGSIGRSNWNRLKRFLKALVSKLDVSDSGTHIAAVAYSDNPIVGMRFSDFQGVDQVNRLFDEMRWQRGFTYTDKALLRAATDLFQTSNGMRPDVRKVSQSLVSHYMMCGHIMPPNIYSLLDREKHFNSNLKCRITTPISSSTISIGPPLSYHVF